MVTQRSLVKLTGSQNQSQQSGRQVWGKEVGARVARVGRREKVVHILYHETVKEPNKRKSTIENTMWYMYTMEFYLVVKKNEIITLQENRQSWGRFC